MQREMLIAILPWLSVLVVSCLCLCLLVRAFGGTWSRERLRSLHADQTGAVQSLSFVLTLPVFVMVLLFILQVSQLMIGTVTVHYAAFAAARSAAVWIPANLGTGEEENRVGGLQFRSRAANGTTYRMLPGGAKFNQIRYAAALACAPISPSRNTSAGATRSAGSGAAFLTARLLAPGATQLPRTAARIAGIVATAPGGVKHGTQVAGP